MDPGSRQLGAVWFADIVGYTRLAHEDESVALRLVDMFQEIARREIEGHGGSVAKFLGDGVLAFAPSAGAAIETILQLRQTFQERSVTEVVPSLIRVGAHLGDVVVKADGDLFGDGVNVASRLEEAAGPGRIYISEDLWRQCRQRVEFEFADLGPHRVKGIDEPIHVYELSPPATDPNHLQQSGLQDRPVNSLAVLPFEVVGSSDDAAFLASGLHSDLLTELSRIPDITVISRTSAMAYRDTEKPIPLIARELNVGIIIEGAVQAVGNRMRMNVQLIDGSEDAYLWADYFDRELSTESLFEIQTELTSRIVQSLHAKLAPGRPGAADGPGTQNLDAYRLAVEGRMQFDRKTEEGLSRAIELFEQALARDSEYALAWVGLTDSLAMKADYRLGHREALIDAATSASRRAEELLPGSAETHTSRGLIAESDQDAPTALHEYAAAIEVRPGYADPHSWFAWVSLVVGDGEAAVISAARSVQLNPLSPEAVTNLALAHLAVGDPAAAVIEARRAKELTPEYTTGAYYEAIALYDLGRLDDAVALLTPLSVAVAGEPQVSWADMAPDAGLALAHLGLGDEESAREILATIPAELYPFEAGMVLAGLHEIDETFSLLLRTDQVTYGPTLAFHHHYRDVWARISRDPRFHEVRSLVYGSWKAEPPRGD